MPLPPWTKAILWISFCAVSTWSPVSLSCFCLLCVITYIYGREGQFCQVNGQVSGWGSRAFKAPSSMNGFIYLLDQPRGMEARPVLAFLNIHTDIYLEVASQLAFRWSSVMSTCASRVYQCDNMRRKIKCLKQAGTAAALQELYRLLTSVPTSVRPDGYGNFSVFQTAAASIARSLMVETSGSRIQSPRYWLTPCLICNHTPL